MRDREGGDSSRKQNKISRMRALQEYAQSKNTKRKQGLLVHFQSSTSGVRNEITLRNTHDRNGVMLTYGGKMDSREG